MAESSDLVHWSPLRTALRPLDPRFGCWSGTAVVDDGQLVLIYTRVDVRPGQHDIGQVMLARADGDGWVSEAEPVLSGPPTDLDVRHLRDPFLMRTDDGWLMLLGAGLGPDTAAVLGYRSPDLRRWEFGGILCSGPLDAVGPVSTGSVWECPQLYDDGGQWVLVVAAAHERPEHIVAAIGSFDGAVFTPDSAFHRLAYGDAPYATTTFLDADGRRCGLSWLREPGPVTGAWAGALSCPPC